LFFIGIKREVIVNYTNKYMMNMTLVTLVKHLKLKV